METDRHESDGEDRHGEPVASGDETSAPRSHDAPAPPAEAGTGSGAEAEQPHSASHDDSESHDYGYGQDLEAAGTGGRRAADSGTGVREATGLGAAGPESDGTGAAGADTVGVDAAGVDTAGVDGSGAPGTGSDAAADSSTTGIHPVTGVRGATTPRAVLRPVPEGFPTPPPRPAKPNRRPARPATEDTSAASARPRRLLIAGIALAAVLLLVIVVGGGILAFRALTSEESQAPADESPSAGAPADPAGPGEVEIGGVLITEISTEVGVRGVGSTSRRLEPEGEFIVVTYEVENPTDTAVGIGQNLQLTTADGPISPDDEATTAYEGDSVDYAQLPPGESQRFHVVFDAPIGTDPTGLSFDLVTIGESGTLPLGG